MSTGRRRSLAAFQIGEIGLALAKARNFWGGHGKARAAQSHAKILVVPIWLIALATVFPQTDDVLDTVPVAVESHDCGQGTVGTFGQQDVHWHLRVGAGTQDYFLPRVIAFVDFFYFARCQVRLIASLYAQMLGEGATRRFLPTPRLGRIFGLKGARGCRWVVLFPQRGRRLQSF